MIRAARPLVLAALLLSPAYARAAELAKPADAFVDNCGVATHFGYPDTPYGAAYDKVRDRLFELGFRHVRDGKHAHFAELAAHGVHTALVTDVDTAASTDGIRDFVREINATNPGAIDAVEGPNEPDLFWPKYHPSGYHGAGFPDGAIAFQKDLFTSMKSDPATAGVAVFGIALGKTLGYGDPNPLGSKGELEAFVDWGNFHPYPGGNPFNAPFAYDDIDKYYWNSDFPTAALETSPGPGLDGYDWILHEGRMPYGDKPMAATETGYSTFTGSLSRTVHAKYMVRLFLEYFRLGIRGYSYELVDEFDRADDREANFGLLDHAVNPKPAYTALSALVKLLADPGPAFTPHPLDFEWSVHPPKGFERTYYVHHLVLEKRDGRRYLVFWHEISDDDTSSKPVRELSPPAMPTHVVVHEPYAAARLHRFAPDGTLSTSDLPSASTIDLDVPDQAVIIELLPTSLSGGDASGEPDGPDAGQPADAAASDATPSGDSGCGCRTAPAGRPGGAMLLAALCLSSFRAGRRRSGRRCTSRP